MATARTSDSCLMPDYVYVINFLLLLLLLLINKCRHLIPRITARIFALAAKYHIEPHDVVRSSVARIKESFWFYFSESV